MSAAHRKSHPAMLGLFVVTGLIVLFVAVVTLAGGRLLVHKQKVVMHYAGSVYGLQVGAPLGGSGFAFVGQVIPHAGKPIQAENRGAQLFRAEPRRDWEIFIVVDAHRLIVPAIQSPRVEVECGIVLTGLGYPGSLTTKFIRAGGEIGRRTRFRS